MQCEGTEIRPPSRTPHTSSPRTWKTRLVPRPWRQKRGSFNRHAAAQNNCVASHIFLAGSSKSDVLATYIYLPHENSIIASLKGHISAHPTPLEIPTISNVPETASTSIVAIRGALTQSAAPRGRASDANPAEALPSNSASSTFLAQRTREFGISRSANTGVLQANRNHF